MVFLTMNTWLKYAEDAKNWIKTLEKCAFVGLHHIIVSQCMVQKIPILTLVYTHIYLCWTLWTTPQTWTKTLARMPVHFCVFMLATVNWAELAQKYVQSEFSNYGAVNKLV